MNDPELKQIQHFVTVPLQTLEEIRMELEEARRPRLYSGFNAIELATIEIKKRAAHVTQALHLLDKIMILSNQPVGPVIEKALPQQNTPIAKERLCQKKP